MEMIRNIIYGILILAATLLFFLIMYDSLKCFIPEFMMFINKGNRFKYAKWALSEVCRTYEYDNMKLQEDGDTLKIFYNVYNTNDSNIDTQEVSEIIKIVESLNGNYKYNNYEFICSVLKLDEYANYVEDAQFNYSLSREKIEKINWKLIDEERLMKLL